MIGWYDQGFFSVSDDGKILWDGVDLPMGRNALEYIYSFCEDLPENAVWL